MEVLQKTVSANNASASRTSNNASVSIKSNAAYISAKTKEINDFKLPGQNDFKYININEENYRIRDSKTSDGRHIVDIIRTSDRYSLVREVFTKSGFYGSARTNTRAQVQRSVRKLLLDLLNK